MIEEARRDSPLNDPALAPRRAFAGGSFFDAIPTGADAYLLKAILHDWGDGDATRILRALRRALPSDGTLLVVEVVLAPGNASSVGKLLDLARVIPTASPYSILVGTAG